jgi:hypothetical protein
MHRSKIVAKAGLVWTEREWQGCSAWNDLIRCQADTVGILAMLVVRDTSCALAT